MAAMQVLEKASALWQEYEGKPALAFTSCGANILHNVEYS